LNLNPILKVLSILFMKNNGRRTGNIGNRYVPNRSSGDMRFRLLISLFMYSHGITKDTYAFIPILYMTKRWTDEKLYRRYELTKEDIAFIESMVHPMRDVEGAGGEASDE